MPSAPLFCKRSIFQRPLAMPLSRLFEVLFDSSVVVKFSKHATTGDGILTALMLMEVILEKKQSLGTLCKGMQMYPQLLKNVRVEDKAAVTGNVHVQEEKERISTALGEDGRILLRESGTEPVIRVMVEAQSDELCAKYVDEVVQVIREEGLAVE